MKSKLSEYLKNKKIYVISPHFDDAALSCGNFISEMRNKNITVINVFTRAHSGPYTLSAKQFLKSAGFKNADELYVARKKEDVNVLKFLGVSNMDFGLTDALFRKKKTGNFLKFFAELIHMYPTYRFHVVRKIAKADYAPAALVRLFKAKIERNSVVIVPYGIGCHVDHLICRNVCEKLFDNVIYYEDFPYNLRLKSPSNVPGYKKIGIKTDIAKKRKLIGLYESQVNSLFENGKIPPHREEFYVKEDLI